MKKVQVLATKLNNGDVIATSGENVEPCLGKYHLYVASADNSGPEYGYLFDKWDGVSSDMSGQLLIKPADLNDLGTLSRDGDYERELGTDAQTGDFYYWDGSTWIKCSADHDF